MHFHYPDEDDGDSVVRRPLPAGYHLADVRPGYARVVRADGSRVGHVENDRESGDDEGGQCWDVYNNSGRIVSAGRSTCRLAVAALVEADMLARQQEGEP